MKNKILIAVALGVATVMVGCSKNTNTEEPGMGDTNASTTDATNAWQKTKEATTNAWQDVKTGSANAWEDMKDSMSSAANDTYDQKDAFVAAANSDLAALDVKIQKLSDKMATASDNAKADAQTKMQDLREKRAALDQKLTDLKNSTDANWNDAKTSFQSAYDDAKASVKAAWQSLKDKMS
jgi:predicted  nucleic acid-binding Zn-ribbon protein